MGQLFLTVGRMNSQVYLRLKLALTLGLRRQIFIAVCDDLELQNRLAAQLHHEIASEFGPKVGTNPLLAYPRLVSLYLNLPDPNPLAQINQWLAQYPPLQKGWPTPSFQILGIERLTRQPAAIQRLFVSYLQSIERHLAEINSSWVIWVPRPWLRTLQESAPDFWQCHTALFEFAQEAVSSPSTPSIAPSSQEKDHASALEPPIAAANPAAEAQLWEMLAQDLAHLQAQEADQSSTSEPLSQATANSRRSKRRSSDALDRLSSQLAEANSVSQSVAPLFDPEQSPTLTSDALQNEARDMPPLPASPQETARVLPPPEETAAANTAQTLPAQEVEKQPTTAPVLTTKPSQQALDEFMAALQLLDPAHNANTSLTDRAATHPNPELAELIASLQTAVTDLKSLSHQSADLKIDDLYKTLAQLLIESRDQESSSQQQCDAQLPDQTGLPTPTADSETQPTTPPDLPSDPEQLLDHIEHLYHQKAPAIELAMAYRSLGDLYRDRIEVGDRSLPMLSVAIQAYEQAVQCLAQHDQRSVQASQTSYDSQSTAVVVAAALPHSAWPDLLNDLANLYWLRSREQAESSLRLADLEQAIAHYQQAIHRAKPEELPHVYAMIQNNLGAAYGDMARYRDPAEHLQRSILAYQEALRYRQSGTDLTKYAATQNNLGTAYWHLAQYEQPRIYLKQAIVAYTEALRAYSLDREPANHAMLQNNLGTAYWNLSQYERPQELLMLAIEAYQIALQHRTAAGMPAAHAATQNNLGTAYWHLANQVKGQSSLYQNFLQEAIAAYTTALKTISQHAGIGLTFDHYATYNNLGVVYCQLVSDSQANLSNSEKTDLLERALDNQLRALQGWQSETELHRAALNYLIQTVRAFYRELGSQGQSLALAKIPAQYLPEILPKL